MRRILMQDIYVSKIENVQILSITLLVNIKTEEQNVQNETRMFPLDSTSSAGLALFQPALGY